ncbi:hypothetical protein JW710_00210 [Candidatus Dojkabacteria bacterium]|nr:hypothetical protein [Candidatus Dojkabacteria bacterium]
MSKKPAFITFLKNNWQKIFLLLILLAAIGLNINWGKFCISNDNYSPELEPSVTIGRSLISPAWRGYRALGVPSDSEQSDLFRSGMYYAWHILLPKWALGQLYAFFCLALGALFFGKLAEKITKDYGDEKIAKHVYLLAGVVYLTTLWTAWVYSYDIMVYITQFGFLPFLLLACYNFIKKSDVVNALVLMLAGFLISASSLIATVFIVQLGVVCIFALFWSFVSTRKIYLFVTKAFLTIIVFVSTQLFWLVPFFHYVSSTQSDVVESYTNRSITASTIELEKASMDGWDSARLYTRLLEVPDSNYGDEKMFAPSDDYREIEFLNVISYLPLFFSVVGLIFVLFKKKFGLLFFWVLAIAAWFLIKNLNPPFGEFYAWLQDNFAIFRQIFRWPTSKFGGIYLIGFAFTASIGAAYLFEFMSSFFKKGANLIFSVLVAITIGLQLVFGAFVFDGNLVPDRAWADIPESYYELRDYLVANNPDKRLYIMPPSNTGYFREYDWNFIGSGFLHYIVPNPIADLAMALGSDESEKAMDELTLDYFADPVDFRTRLENYDVGYVLVDRSLIKGRYGYEIDWDLVEPALGSMTKVWASGDLELYEVPQSSKERMYTELHPGHDMYLSDKDYYVKAEPEYGAIYPALVDLSGLEPEGGLLRGSFMYEGKDAVMSDNLDRMDISQLPTRVYVDESRVVVEPSLPSIGGVSSIVPYMEYPLSNKYENLVVGDQVIAISSIIGDEISVDTSYGDISAVYGLKDADFTGKDYRRNLKDADPVDCSGEDLKDIAEVEFEDYELTLTAHDGIGCVAAQLPKKTGTSVAKVQIGWSADEGTLVGFCLWSEKRETCLNNDKFLYSNEGENYVEMILPSVVDPNEAMSVILYVFAKDSNTHSAVFDRVEVLQNEKLDALLLLDKSNAFGSVSLYVENGQNIDVEIPVVRGRSSYRLGSVDGFIWEPVYESGDEELNLTGCEYWSDPLGMHQKTYECSLTQWSSIYRNPINQNMMWYWYGENDVAVPAYLNLSYDNDERKWVEEVFADGELVGDRLFFKTNRKAKNLSSTMETTGFDTLTENILKDMVVQSVPDGWVDYVFSVDGTSEYGECEAESISDSPYSAVYAAKDVDPAKVLSIPQATSEGWTAYAVENADVMRWLPEQIRSFVFVVIGSKLPDSSDVTLRGWKQGWIVPSSEIENGNKDVVVIYKPNLYAYAGGLTSLVVLVGLCVAIYIYKKKTVGKSAK